MLKTLVGIVGDWLTVSGPAILFFAVIMSAHGTIRFK